jgi:hypothetical protein
LSDDLAGRPDRRAEVARDDTGDRPYLFTSYNASSGGTIVNQVQDAYNGLGQLTGEHGKGVRIRKCA